MVENFSGLVLGFLTGVGAQQVDVRVGQFEPFEIVKVELKGSVVGAVNRHGPQQGLFVTNCIALCQVWAPGRCHFFF